jgi:iron transport multicopper oxidase
MRLIDYEGQYPDGLRGALIVQDPNSPFKGQYDEEIVVTLSDWYHDQMPTLTNYYLNSSLNEDGSEPIPYSALMNDAQNTKLYVQPDKTYFLRIINFAGFSQMFLHFDRHQMTIIEIDGIYTKPRVVDNVYLAVAQRYGVLLKTKPTASKNYAALAKLDETMYDPWDTSLPNNGIPAAVNPDVTGYLVYDNKTPLPPPLKISIAEFYANKIDDFTLTPYDNEPLLQNPTQTFVLELRFFAQDGQNR